jgi:hypothetical protein
MLSGYFILYILFKNLEGQKALFVLKIASSIEETHGLNSMSKQYGIFDYPKCNQNSFRTRIIDNKVEPTYMLNFLL